jgi:hypothetical protein
VADSERRDLAAWASMPSMANSIGRNPPAGSGEGGGALPAAWGSSASVPWRRVGAARPLDDVGERHALSAAWESSALFLLRKKGHEEERREEEVSGCGSGD